MAYARHKRVWCLYRVSTVGQVDHDDIPMQRDMCHKFALTHPDWVIENELLEKGVSGFKTSADNREALIMLKEAAQSKQFDVLLVFMFDRIGRRTDETPLIMQWFVKQGIEIWSTREGQRKYDTPEDELIGWLGTWLASGESRKISMRVSASKASMASRGFYTGGLVPYGFDAKRIGRVNKKDQPVKDLVINELEAGIVEFMFRAIVDLGHGTPTIANALNAMNIATKKKSARWRATSIRAILRNPIYIGRMKVSGELSDVMEQYRIVEDHYFYKAEEILTGRSPFNKGRMHGAVRRVPENKGLLTGIIYCGSCGSRLTFNHNVRRKVLASGEYREYEQDVYRCTRKIDDRTACTAASTNKSDMLDRLVLDLVRQFFINVKRQPKVEMLRTAMASDTNVLSIAFRQADKTLKKAQKDMATLEEEAIKSITGDGSYTVEVINRLMQIQKEKLARAEVEMARLGAEMQDEVERSAKRLAEIEQIQSWADSFDAAPFDQKKVIVATVVEKVLVKSVRDVEVIFRLTTEQYTEYDIANTGQR